MRDDFFEYFQAQAATDAGITAALTGSVAALDWEELRNAKSPLEEAKALAERWLQAGDDVAQLAAFSPEGFGGYESPSCRCPACAGSVRFSVQRTVSSVSGFCAFVSRPHGLVPWT